MQKEQTTHSTCEDRFTACENIFLRLSSYWRSALFGFVALLGLGAGVWTWTWAEVKADQKRQDTVIEEMQAAFNDIAYLRSQSQEILDNQEEIIKHFKIRKPR